MIKIRHFQSQYLSDSYPLVAQYFKITIQHCNEWRGMGRGKGLGSNVTVWHIFVGFIIKYIQDINGGRVSKNELSNF